MEKKILFCASTVSHIKNFHLPYLKAFHDQGYEVWIAVNKEEPVQYADKVVVLPFCKSYFSFRNIKAIIEAWKMLKRENFSIVSTHTTLASSIVRAAILMIRNRPKVFNTSHGYLFHEGDGLKKWIYLLPEKICANVTDVLMVMNHEDYDIAKKYRLYKDKLYYINGMGVDLNRFAPVSYEERLNLRTKYGFTKDDFLFVYAAEFSKRKNQNLLIQAFGSIHDQIPNAKILLAGEGALLQECRTIVSMLGLEDKVKFLGYVEDINQLYAICDVCVTTSLIEGLPFNVMEAMACRLPVVASNIKGHKELVEEGNTGLLFESGNRAELQEKMKMIYESDCLRLKFQEKSKTNILDFSIEKVKNAITDIYITSSGAQIDYINSSKPISRNVL